MLHPCIFPEPSLLFRRTERDIGLPPGSSWPYKTRLRPGPPVWDPLGHSPSRAFPPRDRRREMADARSSRPGRLDEKSRRVSSDALAPKVSPGDCLYVVRVSWCCWRTRCSERPLRRRQIAESPTNSVARELFLSPWADCSLAVEETPFQMSAWFPMVNSAIVHSDARYFRNRCWIHCPFLSLAA